jgi:hypothetical protein
MVVVGWLLAETSLWGVPDVICVKQFEVVNGEGQTLVLFGENKSGEFLRLRVAMCRTSRNLRHIKREEQSRHIIVAGRLLS